MKLADLVRDLEVGSGSECPPWADLWADLEVTAVQDDSRQVGPGTLFVAIAGLRVDGHDYAAAAVARGAVAVVAGRELVGLTVPCLVVPDPPRALALCAARLAGDPARSLRLLGITGTNGKTTTTYLMEQILQAAGRAPGVIGTVAYRFAGRSENAPFTTPTPLVLQQVLGRMRLAGCRDVVMEVSSHALELGRLWGLSFAVAAFTHLTQDHLDLHGSMEAYLSAKLLLFSRHLQPGGTAVVNLDGAAADAVVQTVRRRGDVRLLGCSSQGKHADVQLLDLHQGMEGLRARLVLGGEQVEVASPLIGNYNADNILLAAACCHAAGVDPETVARGVAALEGVPGRLERVTDPADPYAVLVDYAHTPDALVRAMEALRPLCPNRLIVVFGCGGDRDRTKRPLMGSAVARIADLAVVTSDNPRTEDPHAIIEAILDGVRVEGMPLLHPARCCFIPERPDRGARTGTRTPPRRGARTGMVPLDRLEPASAAGYIVEPDRRQAIETAVRTACPGDIVLIAGKGHEDYQILGDRRIHFDDREEARKALASR